MSTSSSLASAHPIALSNATLDALPNDIARPSYDRAGLRPGIIHIGLGNFHRAHQAWYLHRLMQQGKALDWAIIGAGVKPYDATMRDKLRAQDCLTTLIALDPSGTSAEVTGPMIDYLPVEPGHTSLIAAMADPAIRIVSLTVTEGGYFQNAGGGFDAIHPDIQADTQTPQAPTTAFGAMVAALAMRRKAGSGPFTAQSCDNLQGNGDILRQTLVSLAKLSDPNLAEWIAEHVSFPNSMVDCIVPATGPTELDKAHMLGIADAAPVTHESFRQWVLEDSFCAGRPPWEEVGATFTADVHSYEAMKIRVLNAGHQVLANAGELLGLPTIAACMEDASVAGLFAKVQTTEILPQVAPVPEYTPQDYLALITQRFANTAIVDTTRRVAFDGSSRHTGFVLPILRAALDQGQSIQGLALVEALWARMCAGTREDGSSVEPNDPHWSALTTAAQAAKTAPSAWLAQSQFYGELAQNTGFATAFDAWLTRLWATGTRATIDHYLTT